MSSLTLDDVQPADAGVYRCTVTLGGYITNSTTVNVQGQYEFFSYYTPIYSRGIIIVNDLKIWNEHMVIPFQSQHLLHPSLTLLLLLEL